MCVQRRFYGVVGKVNKLDRRRVFFDDLTASRSSTPHRDESNKIARSNLGTGRIACGRFLDGENLT